MKECKGCGTVTPGDFYETQHARWCRVCFGRRYVAPGRERLLKAKLGRGSCLDCGMVVTVENACVMDFDHIGDDKQFNVSKMMTCSTATFEAELAKTELVCANCHRLRTKARGRRWPKGGRPRLISPPDASQPSTQHSS